MTSFLPLGSVAGKGGGGTPPDVTPGAVNWGNISGVDEASNSGQTISDITSFITLRATFSGVSGDATGTIVPNVAGVEGTGATVSEGGSFSFVVSNGQSVYFTARAAGTALQARNCTVTITNSSDGGATLDTFTSAVTVGA